MRVVRAKTAGFCMGVNLAVKRLEAAIAGTAQKEGARLATLGPIIHNPPLIREYEDRGVVCLGAVEEAQPGDTVLIRAHGVPREMEGALIARGTTVLDATCPKVKKAQIAIAEAWRQGGSDAVLLLYGEADHPEVRGLVSYAEGNAHVFLDLHELAAIPLDPDRSYFLAAQTTQDVTGFDAARAWLAERLGHTVPVLHTICDATRRRQEEVIALAGTVPMVVVVGGTNSGNTRRLADVAEKAGARSILVEDASQLHPDMVAGVAVVGLTAGASTPVAHIDAVEAWLAAQP